MAVVVGLSDSDLGRVAVDRAVEEAKLRDVPLVLASHATAPRRDGAVEDLPEDLRRARARLGDRARELSERGVRCITSMPAHPASATEALLAAAEEHDAELIVVGVRRRSPVGKAVLGSTAQDVVLRANCGVLAVKLPEDVEAAR